MPDRYFPLLLLVCLLSACGFMPIHSEIPDRLENYQIQIIQGESTRNEVHERIGEPLIYDKQLQFEIYRVASGREAAVLFAPIPVWIDTEKVSIYALIIYNDNNIVESVDWDVYQTGGGSRLGFMGGYDWRSARLEAGGFNFIAAKEGAGQQQRIILLAPASKTREFLHAAPSSDKCAVNIFFKDTDFYMEYFLDSELIGQTPLLSPLWEWGHHIYIYSLFSKVLVGEGVHEIRLTTSFKPPEFRRKFSCRGGSSLYIYPQIELVETEEPWGLLQKNYMFDGEIFVSNEPLEPHENWRRLLIFNGKWLGED
jgi:hypothetical protein